MWVVVAYALQSMWCKEKRGRRRELVVVVATMAMAKTMAMAVAKMLACNADGD